MKLNRIFFLVLFLLIGSFSFAVSYPLFQSSNRTLEDEIKFLETLKSINYYSGYGIQELYGVIAFKDGSWLERGEYDGSEWWELCVMPKEPIWEEMFKE